MEMTILAPKPWLFHVFQGDGDDVTLPPDDRT